MLHPSIETMKLILEILISLRKLCTREQAIIMPMDCVFMVGFMGKQPQLVTFKGSHKLLLPGVWFYAHKSQHVWNNFLVCIGRVEMLLEGISSRSLEKAIFGVIKSFQTFKYPKQQKNRFSQDQGKGDGQLVITCNSQPCILFGIIELSVKSGEQGGEKTASFGIIGHQTCN